MGGSMHNNSGASSGTYDDINNNAAVSYFAVKDVSFFDGATPSNSRRNINDDTSGSSIVWDIQANLFYANDTSVVSVKPTRGQALGNTLWQTGKSITRSEEHTSELQSLMRISYAVFCLKQKKTTYNDK